MDVQEAQQVTQYIADVEGIVKGLSDKVAALQEENTGLRTLSQKQASETFAGDQLTQTVDLMIQAGFLKEAERSDAVQKIASDPDTALKLLGELSRRTITFHKTAGTRPVLGRGVAAASSTTNSGEQVRESDTVFDQRFGALAQRLAAAGI